MTVDDIMAPGMLSLHTYNMTSKDSSRQSLYIESTSDINDNNMLRHGGKLWVRALPKKLENLVGSADWTLWALAVDDIMALGMLSLHT